MNIKDTFSGVNNHCCTTQASVINSKGFGVKQVLIFQRSYVSRTSDKLNICVLTSAACWSWTDRCSSTVGGWGHLGTEGWGGTTRTEPAQTRKCLGSWPPAGENRWQTGEDTDLCWDSGGGRGVVPAEGLSDWSPRRNNRGRSMERWGGRNKSLSLSEGQSSAKTNRNWFSHLCPTETGFLDQLMPLHSPLWSPTRFNTGSTPFLCWYGSHPVNYKFLIKVTQTKLHITSIIRTERRVWLCENNQFYCAAPCSLLQTCLMGQFNVNVFMLCRITRKKIDKNSTKMCTDTEAEMKWVHDSRSTSPACPALTIASLAIRSRCTNYDLPACSAS